MIKEVTLTDSLLETLILLSQEWENEDISYGYRKNQREDIEDKRIFVMEENKQVIAYLLGHQTIQKNDTSIIKKDTIYFEVDELYVSKEYRSQGVGKQLFLHLESVLKNEEIEIISLITATKNYKAILHFYIEELGMEFYSCRMYKKIGLR